MQEPTCTTLSPSSLSTIIPAESLLQHIEESVIPATEHPYLYRPGRVPGTREIVVIPHYIVVYRVLSDYLEVLAVLHARQEYP